MCLGISFGSMRPRLRYILSPIYTESYPQTVHRPQHPRDPHVRVHYRAITPLAVSYSHHHPHCQRRFALQFTPPLYIYISPPPQYIYIYILKKGLDSSDDTIQFLRPCAKHVIWIIEFSV